ncbi:MAG: serine hydrolase, partial [Planctomycetota bacterium]
MHSPRCIAFAAIIVCVTASCTVAEESGLGELIEPLIKAHQGEVAIDILNLETGERYQHRADEPMPAASLAKIPVMVAAYQMAADGELDLGQSVTLDKEDKVPGAGILTKQFFDGTELPLRGLIRLMIAYSDNTATNLVIEKVGLRRPSDLMESMGLTETKLHSLVFRPGTSVFPERSKKYGLGSVTAAETIKLLAMLHEGKLVSEAASAEMREHMLACVDDQMIPRFLPPTAKVANKIGAVAATRCDAAIVERRGGAFAICVLTTGNKDQSWGDENAAEILCGRIAKAAYDYFYAPKPKTADAKRPAALALGAQGDLVEALQRTLNERLDPSPSLSVDGDFGPMTEAAVVRFQRAKKLAASGTVTPETWAALGALITQEEKIPSPAEVNSQAIEKAPVEPLTGQPFVTCKAWAVTDGESGELLWGMNAEEPRHFASTTKIMTGYLVTTLAQEKPEILDELVTFSERADNTIGSTSGVKAGEKILVGELLYGLLLPSGNDASVALGEHFGPRLAPNAEGDAYAQFISAMNAKAKELGMDSSGFKNTSGLTAEGHLASAADLAVLAASAMQQPLFREVVGTVQRGATATGPGGYKRNLLWYNTFREFAVDTSLIEEASGNIILGGTPTSTPTTARPLSRP